MEPGLRLVTLVTLQAKEEGAQVHILVGSNSKFKTNLSNLARPFQYKTSKMTEDDGALAWHQKFLISISTTAKTSFINSIQNDRTLKVGKNCFNLLAFI